MSVIDYTDILLEMLYYIKAIYLMFTGLGILVILKLIYNFFSHFLLGRV